MKLRTSAIIGSAILAIAFGVGGAGSANAASDQNQYCYSGFCLNAWSGGPAVNAFTSGQVNNDFFAFANSDGFETIEFTGGGAHNFQCVSDFGNSSTDARAGLNGDCSQGAIAWGANFQLEFCGGTGSGTWAFKNVHWNGYLAPASLADGAAFFLNNATRHCFNILGAG